MLQMKFGALINVALKAEVVPDALVKQGKALSGNWAVMVTAELADRSRATLLHLLGRATATTETKLWLVNALLACTPDGGCLLRCGGGILREPTRSHEVYQVGAPQSARLNRFDNEPWQLWDLPRPANYSAVQAVQAILLLGSHQEQLGEVRRIVCLGKG